MAEIVAKFLHRPSELSYGSLDLDIPSSACILVLRGVNGNGEFSGRCSRGLAIAWRRRTQRLSYRKYFPDGDVDVPALRFAAVPRRLPELVIHGFTPSTVDGNDDRSGPQDRVVTSVTKWCRQDHQ